MARPVFSSPVFSLLIYYSQNHSFSVNWLDFIDYRKANRRLFVLDVGTLDVLANKFQGPAIPNSSIRRFASFTNHIELRIPHNPLLGFAGLTRLHVTLWILSVEAVCNPSFQVGIEATKRNSEHDDAVPRLSSYCGCLSYNYPPPFMYQFCSHPTFDWIDQCGLLLVGKLPAHRNWRECGTGNTSLPNINMRHVFQYQYFTRSSK